MFTGQFLLGRFGHLLAAEDDFVSKVRDVVPSEVITVLFWLSLGLFVLLFVAWLAVRYVPNDRAAVVEKLWSATGSVAEGRIIALNGEAGYQAELLRGGIHFGLWRFQYRVHKVRLVTIAQGKIGYVYARDGVPLTSGQTLARITPCNNFQDARMFLNGDGSPDCTSGQRGRQRSILREGVYAVNLATFVVISENKVHALPGLQDRQEAEIVAQWREELLDCSGFEPIVVGAPMKIDDPLEPGSLMQVDSIGIVTVHDGPSLAPGEIIAPAVGKAKPIWHEPVSRPSRQSLRPMRNWRVPRSEAVRHFDFGGTVVEEHAAASAATSVYGGRQWGGRRRER
jgi:hypothetical protein